MNQEQSPYLNADESAAYLRCTRKALSGYIERGKLRKLPGRRKVYFTREMLDAFMAGKPARA